MAKVGSAHDGKIPDVGKRVACGRGVAIPGVEDEQLERDGDGIVRGESGERELHLVIQKVPEKPPAPERGDARPRVGPLAADRSLKVVRVDDAVAVSRASEEERGEGGGGLQDGCDEVGSFHGDADVWGPQAIVAIADVEKPDSWREVKIGF